MGVVGMGGCDAGGGGAGCGGAGVGVGVGVVGDGAGVGVRDGCGSVVRRSCSLVFPIPPEYLWRSR